MKAEDLRVFDNQPLTPYLATAICEGFCEGENTSLRDVLTAWSYIAKTKLYQGLQGFFGRTVDHLRFIDVLDDNDDIAPWVWQKLENED